MLCIGGVFSSLGRGGRCAYVPLFSASCTVILSALYYIAIRTVGGFLSFMLSEATSASRRCKGLSLSRRVHDVYGECPVHHEVYTIEEVDEEEEGGGPREREGRCGPVPPYRAWPQVYGVGVGVYCTVYSMQSADAFTGLALAWSLVLVSVQELSCEPRAGSTCGRMHKPACIALYAASLGLVAASGAATPRTPLHGVVGAAIPLAGVALIRYLQRPSNLAEVLGTSAPFSCAIGLCCVLVVVAAGGTGCVRDHYLVRDYLSSATSVRIDPTSMTLLFVSPILGVCAVSAALAACSKRRSLDIASGAALLAVARAYLGGGRGPLPLYGVALALLGLAAHMLLRLRKEGEEPGGEQFVVRPESWTPYPEVSAKTLVYKSSDPPPTDEL